MVEAYDPGTNTWSSKASMPTARERLRAVAYVGKILAFGGSTGSSMATVELYDPLTNSWSTANALSVPRATFGAAEVDGKIFAVGGYSGGVVASVDVGTIAG